MTNAAANGKYKIEKSVPLPPPSHSGPHKTKYPFRELEVGESFFIPGKKAAEFGGFRTHYAKEGLQFAIRSVDGGIRVWRVV